MQQINGSWILSPQDVVAEYECVHKVALTAAMKSGALELKDEPDAALELLAAQGLAHEAARLERLSQTENVVHLSQPAATVAAYQAAWDTTRRAMENEADAIYQGTLFTGDFVGFVDFLILERDAAGAVVRDDAGRPIYNPVDAKSARSAKANAVLQVGAYAETLVRLGMPEPTTVHLWLGGEDDWNAPAGPLIALARTYRERVAARIPTLGSIPTPQWAPPCSACARCRFEPICDEGRHQDRDLSLVQAIRSTTRARLVDAGIATIDAMASAGDEQRPPRVSERTFERLRAQAALQIKGEKSGRIEYELVNADALTMPPRSPGDIWFDMEGDPHAGKNGLEYMFGFGFLINDAFDFDTFEAHDIATEKQAFENFVDYVMARWEAFPTMHIYHYANYEMRTLQRLAQQHGTRETQIDDILGAGLLVDLYSIVRQSLRFSTESLSIKYIEAIYGFTHSKEQVGNAMDSVIEFEKALNLRKSGDLAGAARILDDIRSYNRKDCESTLELDNWLRAVMREHGIPESLPVGDDDKKAEDQEQKVDPFADVIAILGADLPADSAEHTPEQHARALLLAALLYHPRERRPAWWKLFDLMKSTREELERASDVLLVSGGEATDWEKPKGARTLQRKLMLTSESEDPTTVLEAGNAFLLFDFAPDGMASPADSLRGYHKATIAELNRTSAHLVERIPPTAIPWSDLPIAILPGAPYDATPIRKAIGAAITDTIPGEDSEWTFPDQAWLDLALSRPPRTNGGLPHTGDDIADICAALRESDHSYVAVQGPPGTGKTYVGSRAVAALAAAGWRIGVVAQSHAVIDNFLEAVHEADNTLALGKEINDKATRAPWHLPMIGTKTEKVESWALGQTAGFVMGGTAWTFTRPAVQALGLDLLVIDEAGQFALANAIACARAARTVLLLGDPQQLPHVSQASHPEAVEQSVLQHIIGDHATMPADRGYFLERTYRMHPVLTESVSVLQYEGRLGSAPVTSTRHLAGITPGLIPVAVDHHSNTTSSVEEGERIIELVRDLVGREWTGAKNDTVLPARPLAPDDIIIVAGYNAQVRLLKRMLADAGYPEISIGTVDKFQGREKVIVIVSMATSSDEDLPRGLEFLLSPNRINVAISRAQWASYLVHSPQLLQAQPSSVAGMQRLGAFLELLRT